MQILGIDPGLATIGLGLIELKNSQSMSAIDWLTIETNPKTPLKERLQEIHDDMSSFLDHHAVDLVVVEKLYFASNTTNAMDVAQARGVILLACGSLPLIEPTPMQLKSGITGDGSADKIQIQTMVQRMLTLDEPPQPDDAADALALALYGALTTAPLPTS